MEVPYTDEFCEGAECPSGFEEESDPFLSKEEFEKAVDEFFAEELPKTDELLAEELENIVEDGGLFGYAYYYLPFWFFYANPFNLDDEPVKVSPTTYFLDMETGNFFATQVERTLPNPERYERYERYDETIDESKENYREESVFKDGIKLEIQNYDLKYASQTSKVVIE